MTEDSDFRFANKLVWDPNRQSCSFQMQVNLKFDIQNLPYNMGEIKVCHTKFDIQYEKIKIYHTIKANLKFIGT